MSIGKLAGIGCGVIIVIILLIMLVCGFIDSVLFPYSINTWGTAYANNYEPIDGTMGFWLGVCPVVGQVCIPFTIVTACCDLIFIPDEGGEGS